MDYNYDCGLNELDAALKKVFERKKPEAAIKRFKTIKNPLYRLYFLLFIILRVFGLSHYNTMGILGYKTYLFDKKFAKKVLGGKSGNMLDIGAGSGHITEQFREHVSSISCIEPAISFQKILQKKGFKIIGKNIRKKYDIITIFNVLDICEDSEEIIKISKNNLAHNGIIIISLPFPIRKSCWTKRKKNEPKIIQSEKISFEKAVSDFYTDFLKKHSLRVTYFTKLPYIVALPESRKKTIYTNGLFVCTRD